VVSFIFSLNELHCRWRKIKRQETFGGKTQKIMVLQLPVKGGSEMQRSVLVSTVFFFLLVFILG